ncbi:MAG: UPF0182 family protein, partial [Armatimonadetes bacterium]|nr:UPF0182 family protein [Candidatus Hippobium faecium]
LDTTLTEVFMDRKKKIGIIITIIAIIVIIKIFDPLANLYLDWLWFSSLHYEKVFATMLLSKISLGLISGIIFFAITYTNLWLARKFCPTDYVRIEDTLGGIAYILKQFLGLFTFAAIIVISVFVGIGASTHWENYQFFTHSTAYGMTDPIFHKDLGFYLFSYPFLKYIYSWFFGVLTASLILTGIMYFVQSGIGYEEYEGFFIKKQAKTHLLILLSSLFFIGCFGYIFRGWEMLFTPGTLFVGMGYTDHKVVLPCLYIMVFICAVCGITILFNIKSKNLKPIITAVATLILGNIIFLSLIPGLYEKFAVTPNQLEKEKPYIENAIKFTSEAYNLENIKIRDFEAENTLTSQDIENNRTTVDNIRLWDAKRLLHSYSQVQTIQQYYSFEDIDVDRYYIREDGGEKKY